jgi:iron complex outermembrane recepter protein
MKQRLFLIFWMISISITALANEGNSVIKGKVTTSDGRPAADVTIVVKGSSKSAITGEDGSFSIRNLAAGTYELEISLIGYETITEKVSLADNETNILNIKLQLSQKELEAVTVMSGRRKFARQSSEYVARLNLKNLENPQVYNSITKELLQDQVVTNFDDALKNSPGLDKLWTATGRGSDGAGYFALRGFSVQPTIINGVAGITNGSPDPAGIERIEVIKGPSGTLFGSSLISFGGLINIVTKKPYDSLGGEVGYTGGSYGLSRITADINTPLNKAHTALLRLNGAYHYENSFQDAGFRRSMYFAPSFSYKVNNRLSFLFNTEFFNSESTNPLMLFINRTRTLVAKNPTELEVNYKKSFTSNDITIANPTINLFGQMSYKLSDKWTSQTVVSRSIKKSDGYYQYVMFRMPGDTLLTRFISDQHSTTTAGNIQQNFIGDFSLAGMRHRLVAGIDFFHSVMDNSNTDYIAFDTVHSVKTDAKYGSLTRAALDARFAQNNNPTKTRTNTYAYSVYASDVINITDRLLGMISLRVDKFDTKGTLNIRTGVTSGVYDQTAVSPKFGVVYQVVKERVAVFANYMNGFRNLAPVTQQTGEVSTFEPQQANQVEGGLKIDLLQHRLNMVLSYYDIAVSNMTRTESQTINGNTYNIVVQDGTQESKGFEAELVANPIPGLNIIAGYSYNDSKMTKSDAGVLGRRPNSAGPRNLANLWMSYAIPTGALKGFGFGFGGNYASENMITNNATTGTFTLPEYTVLNASLFYSAKAYRIGLKMDNITNKEYWKGWSTAEPQMLRRLSANISFRF